MQFLRHFMMFSHFLHQITNQIWAERKNEQQKEKEKEKGEILDDDVDDIALISNFLVFYLLFSSYIFSQMILNSFDSWCDVENENVTFFILYAYKTERKIQKKEEKSIEASKTDRKWKKNDSIEGKT